MPNRLIVCGLLGLALASGCSAAKESADAPPADKRRVRESVTADCMKQKGFSYTPFISPSTQSDLEKRVAGGEYAALKETRSKYGFGIFSTVVYPAQKQPVEDPNEKTKKALPASQRKAYQAAGEACYLSSAKQVLGLELTSIRQLSDMTAKAIEDIDKEMDADPKLVELAGPFAECLRSKGQVVSSSAPNGVNSNGPGIWMDQLRKLGGNVSAGKARPYLAKEVKAALDDLECGKDFYAVYNPKFARLTIEARTKFGFSPTP
ncbi:hypothetical protein ABZ297_25465 [Nonomuraea sp. NPDC005983]|uniref:hypothetical protein n=1 Tax=Nonomuraea sp. NPDC005983 TaxID=3155595 RepID=UPI0033BF9E88